MRDLKGNDNLKEVGDSLLRVGSCRVFPSSNTASSVEALVGENVEYVNFFDFLKEKFKKACEEGFFNNDRFNKILNKFDGQDLAKFFMYDESDFLKMKEITGTDKSKVGGFYSKRMKLGFIKIDKGAVPLWHEIVAIHEAIGHHNENYFKSPLLEEAYPYLMEYAYFLEAQKINNNTLREDKIFQNSYSQYRANLVSYWTSINPERITEDLAYYTFSPFVMTGSQLNRNKFSGYPRNAVATLNMISFALDIPDLIETVKNNAKTGDSQKVFDLISAKNPKVASILSEVTDYSSFTDKEFNKQNSQQSYNIFLRVYRILAGALLEKSKNISKNFPPDTFGAGVLLFMKKGKFKIEIPEFFEIQKREDNIKKGIDDALGEYLRGGNKKKQGHKIPRNF